MSKKTKTNDEPITRETVQARYDQLTREREQIRQQLVMYDGAIQALALLLQPATAAPSAAASPETGNEEL